MSSVFRFPSRLVVPALVAGLFFAGLFAVLRTAPAAAANNLIFDGLVHSSTGEAVLSAPGDGTLLVSNIGSSGQDGVGVQGGNAESLTQRYQGLELLSPGRRVSWQSQVQTTEGSAAIVVLARQNGAGVDLLASFGSFGTATVVVDLYLDDLLKASVTTNAVGQMARLTSAGDGVPLAYVAIFDGEFIFEAPSGTAFTGQLPGGGPTLADLIVIRHPNSPFQSRVQNLVTRPANLASLRIEQEIIEVYDNKISGLDDTRLVPNSPDGPLTVRNLGAPGTTAGVENTEYKYSWCLTCTLSLATQDPAATTLVDITERFLSNNGDLARYAVDVEILGSLGQASVSYERAGGTTRVCPQATGPLFPGGWEAEVRQGATVLFSASGGNGDCATLSPILSIDRLGHESPGELTIGIHGRLQGVGPVNVVTSWLPLTLPLQINRSSIEATWPNWAVTNID